MWSVVELRYLEEAPDSERRRIVKRGAPISAAILLLAVVAASAASVRVDWSGGGDYLTIQDGLNAVTSGDTVFVAPGTYTGPLNRNIDFMGMSVLLVSEEGTDETVVDCEFLNRAFYFHSGEGADAIVDGFLVTRGDAGSGGGINCTNGSQPTIRNCEFLNCIASYGGGINCDAESNPRIENCRFVTNVAGAGGGGLRVSGSSKPALVDVYFYGNRADFGGGMVAREQSGPTLTDVVFEANTADWSGGMRVENSNALLTNVLFLRNEATQMGGGLGIGWGSVTSEIVNCTFLGNSAPIAGGMICWSVTAVVTNCTFAMNSGLPAGGLYVKDGATLEVSNSIFAFNLGGGGVACQAYCYPMITQCCVFGNAGGDGLCGTYYDNIFEAPYFCDLMADDVTLHESSPCLPENNPFGVLIGAHGVGCSGPVPVSSTSWGAIKGLYR